MGQWETSDRWKRDLLFHLGGEKCHGRKGVIMENRLVLNTGNVSQRATSLWISVELPGPF